MIADCSRFDSSFVQPVVFGILLLSTCFVGQPQSWVPLIPAFPYFTQEEYNALLVFDIFLVTSQVATEQIIGHIMCCRHPYKPACVVDHQRSALSHEDTIHIVEGYMLFMYEETARILCYNLSQSYATNQTPMHHLFYSMPMCQNHQVREHCEATYYTTASCPSSSCFPQHPQPQPVHQR